MPRHVSNLALVAPRPRVVDAVPDWRAFLLERLERPQLSVSELIALWLSASRPPVVKPGTFRDYESAARRHLGPSFGALDARDVTPDIVAAWVAALLASGRARKTVRKIVSHLSRCMAHGVRIGAVDINPCRHLPEGTLPPNRVRDPRRMAAEVLALADVRTILRDERIPFVRRLFWALLLLGGLRFGEAAALTYGDYRARNRRLVVSKSWDCRARELVSCKTDEVRHVPVHAELRRFIAQARAWFAWREQRPATDEDLIAPFSEHEEVSYWHQTTALRRWRSDLELLGIEDPTPSPRKMHATRHTMITQLLQAGADRFVVASFTHDADLTQTGTAFDVYAHHTTWAAALEAIDLLDLDASPDSKGPPR